MNVLRFFLCLCSAVLIGVVAFAIYARANADSGILSNDAQQASAASIAPELSPPQGVILPGELDEILSEAIDEDSSENKQSDTDDLPLLDAEL